MPAEAEDGRRKAEDGRRKGGRKRKEQQAKEPSPCLGDKKRKKAGKRTVPMPARRYIL